jgi:hypothetical protein
MKAAADSGAPAKANDHDPSSPRSQVILGVVSDVQRRRGHPVAVSPR